MVNIYYGNSGKAGPTINARLALSIITLTKNRAPLLTEHLQSLCGQIKHGDELIIIDNASTDDTAAVISAFRHELPIRSFISHANGFPKLYNLAIRKARNPIIVFFDDDCIASPGFLAGHRTAHRDGIIRVVEGQSFSRPKGNIYADMMGDHYQNWFTVYMTANGQLRTFDNKNVSMPRRLFKKYGVYLPSLSRGGEDIELGFRFHAMGIPIIFAPHIIAYHYERTTFAGFVRQHLRFARSDARLAHQMNQETTLTMFVGYKIFLHTKSALRRELLYLRSGNIRDAVYLPFLYAILFFLRIWGYATAR